jgi:hypothetical protein
MIQKVDAYSHFTYQGFRHKMTSMMSHEYRCISMRPNTQDEDYVEKKRSRHAGRDGMDIVFPSGGQISYFRLRDGFVVSVLIRFVKICSMLFDSWIIIFILSLIKKIGSRNALFTLDYKKKLVNMHFRCLLDNHKQLDRVRIRAFWCPLNIIDINLSK